MKIKIHGIISLLLFAGALLISFYAIQKYSIIMALSYLLIVIISSLIIIYSYCAKCKCHEKNCAHLIVGPIAKLLPKRKMGKYTLLDYIGVFIPILLIFFLPQYWLFMDKVLLILFWILSIIAVIEIIGFVCKSCENDNCLLCRNKK